MAEPVSAWNPIPEDIRDIDMLVGAWSACLQWSLGFAPIQEQFAQSPGGPLKLARGGIAAMIDKATGFDQAEIRRYIEWFNENVWGECGPGDDAPPLGSDEVAG